MKLNHYLFLGIILFTQEIFSQSINFDCGTVINQNANNSISIPFEGYFKPIRTDTLNGSALPSEAFFPVLVVFVQFKNEASDPRHTWDTNSAPVYLSNLIATQKKTSGNWWNYYNESTEILSDHWMEISRGKLHVVSPNGAFSVVLSHEASYYAAFGTQQAELIINAEIWRNLNSQGLTDWRPYDRWKKVGGQFIYTTFGEGDSLVDMIYKVHKSRKNGGLPDIAGYASLTTSNADEKFLVDTLHNIKIDYGSGQNGSGLTVSFRGQLSQYIGTLGHEHGHYLFSIGHSTYSRVHRGYGYDYFYSPADMILNNYMSTKNINLNSNNILGDYSSRNTGGGEIFKIPIQGNEYFLMVNRNKISKWDRILIGDSSQIGTYDDYSEYGKGLYIYHVPDGINFPFSDISQQDMECADGVFQWEYAGQSAQQVIHDCFISAPNGWPYYRKTSVIYDNDITTMTNHYGKGDGISFNNYNFADTTFDIKWWGEGEQPTNNCNIGTDRIFTNKKEIYTSFEMGGDRWDAWRPGYNEIFSPYSSPSTNTWNTNPTNQYSGIFIWYHSFNSSTKEASIKVYKVTPGVFSEDSILHLTPPSRPMGIKIENYHSISPLFCYPKVVWNHNNEPDMLRTGNVKQYKIYKASQPNMSGVPSIYSLFATQNIHKDSTPYFVDLSVNKYDCSLTGLPPYGTQYPVRYYVKAVDKYNDESVPSDFASTVGVTNGGIDPIGPDNFISINPEIPKEFSLEQNYPNPFNPSTNTQYDLPSDNFVTIKVYDILGKEVVTLVNEFKNAGSYMISFNASNLSSGIYYYKIESGNGQAGSFKDVKKMIILK